MYHAAGEKVVGGCTERAIDLLQLIVSACEMRGEDRVRQLADTRREPTVCTSSVSLPVPKNSLRSKHTRVRIGVTRCAVGVEAVFHELRASIAVELTPKPCLCPHAAASYIYRACDVLTMVMLLLVSLW